MLFLTLLKLLRAPSCYKHQVVWPEWTFYVVNWVFDTSFPKHHLQMLFLTFPIAKMDFDFKRFLIKVCSGIAKTCPKSNGAQVSRIILFWFSSGLAFMTCLCNATTLFFKQSASEASIIKITINISTMSNRAKDVWYITYLWIVVNKQ